MVLDVHVPTANSNGDLNVLEFYNTGLGHYFLSANPSDTQYILNGFAGPGWELTGQAFKAWLTPPDPSFAANPVCRFYAPGPNSHFFTAIPAECDFVKHLGGWIYEVTSFYIRPVDSKGECPAGYLQVQRAYNNGSARNDTNHRFSTSDSTMRAMAAKGWIVEGPVMCARP